MHESSLAGGVYLPPVVIPENALVVFSGQAQLTALNVESGEVAWRSQSLQPEIELKSRSLLADDKSVYGSHVGRAMAWDLQDGESTWTFEPESRFYDLGFYGLGPEHFYASASGGHLLAVEKESGRLAFERSYEHFPRGIAYEGGALYFGQAWVPEGAQGQSRGGLMKVEAATGDSLWSFRTARGGFFRMHPIVEDGTVYAGTRGGENTVFVALDAATGAVRWRNRGVRVYAAAHHGEMIFVNDGEDLIGISKADGRTRWRTSLGAGHGESGLAYLDGHVYHPRGRSLYVLDAETGEVVHAEASPGGGYVWEVDAGAGRVFAQTSNFLVAYEPYGE